MSKKLENKKKDAQWWILLFLFLIVLGIWGVSWYFIATNQSLSEWNDKGTFGDMFGAVNALFSGLAFAGVIYAIYLQTKELKLQREELEQTRIELERSANAQEATEKALNKQVQMQALAAQINMESILFQTVTPGKNQVEAKKRIQLLKDNLNIILKETSN